SRLFYDGPMRFYTNPSNPEFDAWALTYYPSFLNPSSALYQQYATGLFIDNSTGNPPGQGSNAIEAYNIVQGQDNNKYQIALVEPTDSYSNDYATLLNEIGLALAPENGWIMANPNGSLSMPGGKAGQTYADPIIQKVQGYYQEEGLGAVWQDTSEFDSLYQMVDYRATTDNPEYAVIDSTSNKAIADSPSDEENSQTQLTTLAAYYILAPNNPSQGALDFFGGEATSSDWEPSTGTFNHWSPAAAYNIGTPVSPLPPTAPTIFDNGSDGGSGTESDNSTYTVYERAFTGTNNEPVLVLYKPDSVLPDGGASQLTGSDSASTVTLGGSYYVLQSNGALSSTTVTSISLENGEGAILVDPPTSPPPPMVRTSRIAGPVASSPAAVVPATQAPAGTSSGSPGNPGLSTRAVLNAEVYDALFPGLIGPNEAPASQAPSAQPADAFASWANLYQLFSAGLTAKLLRARGNSSSFEKMLGSADDAYAALFSVSPDDAPLNPSAAS
ncbi:MAG TPA: hypothetical protein VMG10_14135, partial [Gemmataceae bacterium]|nr:hypothetical protein [Gemmataceae bacterium]